MRGNSWICGPLAVALCALGGCGEDGGSEPATGLVMPGQPGVQPPDAGTAEPSAGAAGAPAPAVGDDTADPAGEMPQVPSGDDDEPAAVSDPGPMAADDMTPDAFDYAGESVPLDTDLVVAAGETLRVGPGASFMASAGVTVVVDGTLLIEGSADAPVRFMGAGVPRSWEGIVVSGGGHLEASHVEIGGATYGIHALPGSTFTVQDADIGTSFKAAVVQSDGSFDRVAFHASGDPTFSISSAAPITDPNGTLTIVDGSPTVTNSSFDSGAPLVDMVRVRGSSAAVFDHVYITDAHCGIHMEGGPNNSPTVTNSIFDGMAYGVMAYATKPIIEDSIFMNNASDVGFCVGATADNVPQLSNNYYSSGAPLFDPSCVQIGTTDAAPAAAPNPDAGPIGL